MNANRPVLISVIQFQDELKAGQLTVSHLLDKLQHFNVDGIELRRELWANYQDELSATRARLSTAGSLVTYATFSTLFNTNAEAHKLLLHDLDTAKALGSPLLRVFPGAAPTDTTDPAWAAANEAVDYAASLGIIIALENYARLPGGTLSEVRHILDHIPSPALKTNIDIGNYIMHGDDVLEAIRTIGHRAAYAHLKDKSGASSDATTYLGGGTLPMHEIIAALNALPQPIIYCFEFVANGEAEARIAKSIAYLRDFQPSGTL